MTGRFLGLCMATLARIRTVKPSVEQTIMPPVSMNRYLRSLRSAWIMPTMALVQVDLPLNPHVTLDRA